MTFNQSDLDFPSRWPLTKLTLTFQAPVPKGEPHQSYQERVDGVLNNLKTRSTLEEEKLTSVLREKSRANRKFPEAEDLLGQVSSESSFKLSCFPF